MAPGENNKATMDLQSTPREEDSVFSNKTNADKAAGAGALAELDEFADEPDETLAERLWGLSEMFPEPIRNFTYSAAVLTSEGVRSFYGFSRSAVWIFVSSSVILFAPLIFEVERAQMEDMQRSQQKQMLLGPNTAAAGGGSAQQHR